MNRSKIKNVKLGQILHITDDDDFGMKRNRYGKEYKVIGIYPFHVLGICKSGIKRSFSYGHLIQLGYEKQTDELEYLKHERRLYI